jgi:hypothetical protein
METSSSIHRTPHLGIVQILMVLSHGCDCHLFAHLVKVDVGSGVVAVEDASNFLEGGALGLDVDEPDEEKLDKVPELMR